MNASPNTISQHFLVVEDDPATALLIGQTLEALGVLPEHVSTCHDAYRALHRQEFACVVVDMNLPDGTGREIQQTIQLRDKPPPVVFVTADDKADSAIQVLRAGAVEYVIKRPEYLEHLRDAIVASMNLRGALGSALDTEEDCASLQSDSRARTRRGVELIGNSPAMREVGARIERCANRDVAVLITGETGTGKELVARAIHDTGPRADQPFVAINCAAIAGSLFESELFGSARGAFTGAVRDRGGLFASAQQGTLFLDEIGELPLDAQAKLLRVLEDKSYRRIGDTRVFRSGARIVTATNRDLPSEVEHGNFRSDLFYRLDVMNIPLPALRDRLSDLPLLVDHFLAAESGEFGERVASASALDALRVHSWPGNVRELRHAILRTLVWNDQREIESFEWRAPKMAGARNNRSRVVLDWNAIAASLQSNGGRLGPSAEALQVSVRTLQRHMRDLGMNARDFR